MGQGRRGCGDLGDRGSEVTVVCAVMVLAVVGGATVLVAARVADEPPGRGSAQTLVITTIAARTSTSSAILIVRFSSCQEAMQIQPRCYRDWLPLGYNSRLNHSIEGHADGEDRGARGR